MFHLVPTAKAFWLHYAVGVCLAAVYMSLGMTVAAMVPTFEVAQAILGLLGPLFFLFGGLWSPPPQMAPGARWFTYIDPITYAFKAVIPGQFACTGETAGASCAALDSITPFGLVRVDRYEYVSTKYDVHYDEALANLGYLALFIVAFQAMAFVATRTVRHIVR